MLSIEAAAKAKHPIVWIQSEEFRRVATYFCAHSGNRPVFRRDFQMGLMEWAAPEPDEPKRWLGVLEEDADAEGNTISRPVKDLEEQLHHVARHSGILLIENAHLIAEALVPYLSWVSFTWMEQFYEDSPALGPMMVLVSNTNKIPPELARAVDRSELALPTVEELSAIVGHFRSHGVTLTDAEQSAVARAGQGLSEYEFVAALSSSLVEDKRIDAEQVAHIKVKQLSAGSNLEIRVPKFDLSQVGGLDRAKEILTMNAWMWHNPDFCRENATAPLNRIILLGVPGSGKSLLAEAAARALGLDLAIFNVGAMMNRYVGASEENMRNAFRQIKALAPIVLWSDEVGRDFSGGASSAHTDGGTTDRVHGTLLSGLQELPDNVFWMGAANSLAALPPEMLRSGRIDQLMFVGFPTLNERRDIFKIHLGANAEEYDLDLLAKQTPLFTGAEIQTLIKQVRYYVVGKHHRAVTTGDILEYIPRLKNRVWVTRRDEIAAMYKQAKTEWTWASSEQEADADHIIEAAKVASSRRSSAAATVPDFTASSLLGKS